MTLSPTPGTTLSRGATAQTVIALVATFSIVISTVALITAQPVRAVTNTAVLALSTDCSSDMKQIDLSGESYLIQGDVHSNAGIHVSGNLNNATGEVRFNGTALVDPCVYEEPGTGNFGGFDAPFSAGPMDDPLFAVPDPEDCHFDFSGRGPIDLNGEDGGAGEEDVWDLDADPTGKTLKEGLYCHDDQLQQSRQGVTGKVSFYSTGYIDLSNGSDTNLIAYRADGVLTHSTADSVNAVKLAGSGTDADNNSFYNGILYAPNGEGEVSGQWITTGCIVAETVKLDGSNNTIGSCDLGPPPPAPTITVDKTANPLSLPEPGGDFTFTVVVTNTSVEAVTIASLEDDIYGTLSGDADCAVGTVLAAGANCSFSFIGEFLGDAGDDQTDIVTACADDADQNEACDDDDAIVTITDVLPTITVDKTANPLSLPEPGGNFTFTVVVTNNSGESVTIASLEDDIYGTLVGDADCQVGTVLASTGSCTFSFVGAFAGDTGDSQTDVVTVCADDNDENEVCADDDAIVVISAGPVPGLVIDKVASAETITISGPSNALVATPSIVTWTLSYTLTNGPVSGAVITDVVPAGFTFLDALNGGTFASGTVTWNLGNLSSSGSVSFRTTVNPATISRTAPTVNTAVIDSNETPPDNGQDSVTVTVQPPPLGGNPPTGGAVPNTAMGTGIGGEPITVPVELLAATLLGSLGALAYANVRSNRRR